MKLCQAWQNCPQWYHSNGIRFISVLASTPKRDTRQAALPRRCGISKRKVSTPPLLKPPPVLLVPTVWLRSPSASRSSSGTSCRGNISFNFSELTKAEVSVGVGMMVRLRVSWVGVWASFKCRTISDVVSACKADNMFSKPASSFTLNSFNRLLIVVHYKLESSDCRSHLNLTMPLLFLFILQVLLKQHQKVQPALMWHVVYCPSTPEFKALHWFKMF